MRKAKLLCESEAPDKYCKYSLGHRGPCSWEIPLLARLRTALETIRWMSGSNDFSPGGVAHKGWLLAQKDIKSIEEAIAKAEAA